MKSHIVQQSFEVSLKYPVVFGHHVFTPDNESLAKLLVEPGSSRRARCLVILDDGVATAFPQLTEQIHRWFADREDTLDLVCPVQEVSGGEPIKNDYRRVMALVDMMLEYHLCRHSYVIVIGGGAVLDATGFAAALVHRGLRLVRMPSTTLAQDDAGIGVKNGMNLHGGKNSVGTFAAPFAVLNDLSLLSGQSDADWIGGVSEAFKVALIKDSAFFDELCALSPALGRRDADALERVVIRCAKLHLEHIATSGDPFELGSARPLDFGHWSAHQLECMSNFQISHGHAVALGIALDSVYACRTGWMSEETLERLLSALEACGFALDVPEWHRRLGDGRRALFLGLDAFQEHLGGDLCLSMPDGVGRRREISEVDEALFDEAISTLHTRSVPVGS